MKNKILCCIIIMLSIILIGVKVFQSFNSSFYMTEKKENEIETIKKIRVLNPDTREILEMNLEDYILGVVSAEMPASFEIEALKAQAVAARTFAVYKMEHRNEDYDIIIGVADQAYQNISELQAKWQDQYENNYNKIKSAIESTKNEIMTYEGNVIESFYFSMSNGYTENCEYVFKESLPYLTSVESSWDNESLKNYEVTLTFTKEDFCKALNLACEILKIQEINRSDTGRVLTIKINDQEFRGVDIRKILQLRSTDFDIEIHDLIKITTRGYGHGVGMSQYGANGMAKEGYNYLDILKHYYQNVKISKI